MVRLLAWIKDNKRMFFSILAIIVAVANMVGFADFQLDPNISILVVAGMTLILTFIRNRWNV